MDKVSIIVPAYNAEKYIDKCIESLLKQDYENCEIVIIDDGSKDNTYKVLLRYGAKIRIYRQENKGVSAARNKGVEIATGKYIVFCDSDDYVEANYISSLINSLPNDRTLVISKFRILDGKNNGMVDNRIGYETTINIDSAKENIDVFNTLIAKNCLQGPICKVFLRSILIEHNIQFNEQMNWGEDFTFVLDYLHFIDEVKTIDVVTYVYQMYNSFLTRNINVRHIGSFLKVKKKYYDFIQYFLNRDETTLKFFYTSTLTDYYTLNLLGFSNRAYRNNYSRFKNDKIIKESKKSGEYVNMAQRILVTLDWYVLWMLMSKLKKMKNSFKKNRERKG